MCNQNETNALKIKSFKGKSKKRNVIFPEKNVLSYIISLKMSTYSIF